MNNKVDLNNFDYNEFKTEAIARIKSGEPLTGKGGILIHLFGVGDILIASIDDLKGFTEAIANAMAFG